MTSSITNPSLQNFKNLVAIKFQLYNSLFTALPFHQIENTGILLSLFLTYCEENFQKKKSPKEIIESFLQQYTPDKKEQEQFDLLFRFVQYTERQVVLFDALEDAVFTQLNDMNGAGTLTHLLAETEKSQKEKLLAGKLKDFSVRPVLTAHPTQFYPDEVLGIIHDLARSLSENNTEEVNTYLQQLGMTPFLQKTKPTPVDEANSLIWFLEKVFYEAAGKIATRIKSWFPDVDYASNPLIRLGFWPGGDRDGAREAGDARRLRHAITVAVGGALGGAQAAVDRLRVAAGRRRPVRLEVQAGARHAIERGRRDHVGVDRRRRGAEVAEPPHRVVRAPGASEGRDRPDPCDRETDHEHPDGMASIHRADNRSRGPQVKRTASHNAAPWGAVSTRSRIPPSVQ